MSPHPSAPPIPVPPRFRLVAELPSKGGQGRVFVVEDTKVEQGSGPKGRQRSRRVLKLLRRRDDLSDASDRHRLLREFTLASTIHDDNVVTIFEHQSDKVYGDYLVMMYYEGAVDLETYLRSARAPQGLSLEASLRILLGAAKGLAAAHHSAIVHRDVKPANFLVVPHPREPRVILIDFGIGEPIGEQEDFPAITRFGEGSPMTPGYASPEQHRNRRVGPATDLFSLGLVAYEVLTGAPPFPRGTFARSAPEPPPLPSHVPVRAAAAVRRLLSPDSSARGSAEEFRREIEAALRELESGTHTVGAADGGATLPLAPHSTWPKRKWVRRAVYVVGGVAAVLGIVDYFQRQLRRDHSPPVVAQGLGDVGATLRQAVREWSAAGPRCVEVLPLKYDDRRRSTTRELLPGLRSALAGSGIEVRLPAELGGVEGLAARESCPFRVTGTVRQPSGNTGDAVAEVELLRTEGGAWSPVAEGRIGRPRRETVLPRLNPAYSFDTSPGYRGPVGEVQVAFGRSQPGDPCGDFSARGYAESAVRDALRSIPSRRGVGGPIVRVYQTVWEKRYNHFEAEIWYIRSAEGDDPGALMPPCRASGADTGH